MGAVAPVPMKIDQANKIVIGKKVDASLVEEMEKKVSEEINPITDIRSTAEYRRKTAAILLKDVFWKAWHRAGGDK
jgi:carbon-monoxide dehydrogenase medium subunit